VISHAKYPGSMETHDATIIYEQPIPGGETRLHLDLFPALPQSHGALHDAFARHFSLGETDEIPGLVSLRREATLEKFLAFFGCTWSDAQQRWSNLAWMVEYRKQHGRDAYSCVDAWEQFYALLDDQVVPSHIEVAAVEHY
jgi:hypothetical protein